jgi:hypothetical protein
MTPNINGTKSPIFLIEGINSIGKASKTNTMAIMVMMLMDLGR